MLTLLLLASELHQAGHRHPFTEALNGDLHGQTPVTAYLLRLWLRTAIRGLRRAHATLALDHNLSRVRSQVRIADQLEELAAYLAAFAARGPPGKRAVKRLIAHYFQHAKPFLLSAPAQERQAACVH